MGASTPPHAWQPHRIFAFLFAAQAARPSSSERSESATALLAGNLFASRKTGVWLAFS